MAAITICSDFGAQKKFRFTLFVPKWLCNLSLNHLFSLCMTLGKFFTVSGPFIPYRKNNNLYLVDEFLLKTKQINRNKVLRTVLSCFKIIHCFLIFFLKSLINNVNLCFFWILLPHLSSLFVVITFLLALLCFHSKNNFIFRKKLLIGNFCF